MSTEQDRGKFEPDFEYDLPSAVRDGVLHWVIPDRVLITDGLKPLLSEKAVQAVIDTYTSGVYARIRRRQTTPARPTATTRSTSSAASGCGRSATTLGR